MSRSGYGYELDNWDLIRWRGQVASAIRGKRGQKLVDDLIAALDTLPAKRLIANELQTETGEVCALGAVGCLRGISMTDTDPEDYSGVAATFDIAEQLAREIMYENDECCPGETPEQRYKRMKRWAMSLKVKPPASASD